MADEQTVSVKLKRWLLDDHVAMVKCLKAVGKPGEFRGEVQMVNEAKPPDAPEVWIPQQFWYLEFNDEVHPERSAIVAEVGDVVVYYGRVLQKMTVPQFTEEFGVAP